MCESTEQAELGGLDGRTPDIRRPDGHWAPFTIYYNSIGFKNFITITWKFVITINYNYKLRLPIPDHK